MSMSHRNFLWVCQFYQGNERTESTNMTVFDNNQCRLSRIWALRLKATTTNQYKVDSGRVKDCGWGLFVPSF
jgi:hypothetical protein